MAESWFLMALPWWMSRMWEAILSLVSGLLMSRTMKMQSNRDRMVVFSSICSSIILKSSNLPKMGFAAASTEVLELRRVVMPALAILMVCCSMASWMATLSGGFILSNSSMHTIPPSASTKAPPSIWNQPVVASLVIEAVSPAADDPFPEVQTAMAAVCSTNLRNCDLAVEGSPMRRMLMSPFRQVLSGSFFLDPPKSIQAMLFLIYQLPQIPGAMELYILDRSSGSLLMLMNSSSSASVKVTSALSFIFWIPVTYMYPLASWSLFVQFTSITPVTETLSPGTQYEVFFLSATSEYVRATSPVGTSSGSSWIFMVWQSMTSEVGKATKESLPHFSRLCPPGIPSQKVGKQGHCPGWSSMVLWLPQCLHWILRREALIQGLVVLMMIPLTTNSLETMLLLISRILTGWSSLFRITCQFQSVFREYSSFFSFRQFLRAPSITFRTSKGNAVSRSYSCQSKALRSEISTVSTYLWFLICFSRLFWQTRVLSRLKLWMNDLNRCSKWVLLPSTREFGFRFWSEKQILAPFMAYAPNQKIEQAQFKKGSKVLQQGRGTLQHCRRDLRKDILNPLNR